MDIIYKIYMNKFIIFVTISHSLSAYLQEKAYPNLKQLQMLKLIKRI